MVVNDYAGNLIPRGALKSIASKLAPTGSVPGQLLQVRQRLGIQFDAVGLRPGTLMMTPVPRQTLQADTVHLPHQFLAALGKTLPHRFARVCLLYTSDAADE